MQTTSSTIHAALLEGLAHQLAKVQADGLEILFITVIRWAVHRDGSTQALAEAMRDTLREAEA